MPSSFFGIPLTFFPLLSYFCIFTTCTFSRLLSSVLCSASLHQIFLATASQSLFFYIFCSVIFVVRFVVFLLHPFSIFFLFFFFFSFFPQLHRRVLAGLCMSRCAVFSSFLLVVSFLLLLGYFSVFRFRFHTSILSAPGNHIDVVAVGTNLYDSRACRVSEVFDFVLHKIVVLQMLFVSAFCCPTVFFFGAFLCFLYPLPHNFFSCQPQEFELVDFLYRFISLLCIHSISGSEFVPHNVFLLLCSLYFRSS